MYARRHLKILVKLILMSCLLAVGSIASAQTLDQAKADGLIGEKSDGYIGFVAERVSPELVSLVENVNRQRRERYEQIAQQNNISVNEVAQLAYARAVQATRPGHYVEDANGQLVKKP